MTQLNRVDRSTSRSTHGRSSISGIALLAATLVVAAAVAGLVFWLQSTAPAPTGAVVAISAIPPKPPGKSVPAIPAPTPTAPVEAPTAPPVPTPAVAPSPSTGSPSPVITLTPAPDPELVERSPDGPLPVIGRDGRQAWKVYARPFDSTDKRPRISIVISGLGLSKISTQDAIRNLPPDVTLSFLPYYPIAEGLQQARGAGHETVIEMPMEPLDYPRQDPGPRALLTALDPHQNLDRLHWMMSRGTGYIGMMTFMGSRFAETPDLLRPILSELKQRGLAFVDARSTGDGAGIKLAGEVRMPRGVADRVLDTEVSRGNIDQQLAELEDLARRGGSAIGIGSAYPVTINTVSAWASRLAERGIALAPLSAVLVP